MTDDERHRAESMEKWIRGMLGRVLDAERRRELVQQRVVARLAGISQQRISSYERGLVTPSWETFVRILAGLGRRPVLSTASWTSAPVSTRVAETGLLDAVHVALTVIGEREYRIEGPAASYLHRDGAPPPHEVIISIRGEPGDLDDLAVELSRSREVHTVRGPETSPHLEIKHGDKTALLLVRCESRPSVELVTKGQALRVAPADDIRYVLSWALQQR
jgi:transcriptional regulator with XRE-family HTH domain